MNPKPRRALIAVAIVAITGVGVATSLLRPGQGAQAQASTPPPAPAVEVAAAVGQTITEWDEFSGRLEAVERVEIRPRVSGTIEAVHFRDGAIVKKGDPLFTIDPRPYAAEVARAEAALAAAQVRASHAQSEKVRAQRLLDDNAISRREFDERINAASETSADVRGAQAALEAARLNLGYTRIVAPVAGKVSRAEITVGNLVAAGAAAPPLTTLVSVSPVYAAFEVDEQSYLRYTAPGAAGGKDGLPVYLGLADEDGHPHQGKIQSVDNRLDPRSGTIRVRAVFDNEDGRLLPGLYGKVRLGGGAPRPAVLVNDRAIGTDQGKKFVLVADKANKLAYREVELGPTHEGLRVIRKGLASGETIVVNGLQRVRPGDTVVPKSVAMAYRRELEPRGVAPDRRQAAQPQADKPSVS
ncbi:MULTISPECIES: efflux RND transporter periplasmic adaptor subunit [Cupriavidus]|uniref:efflux RND transporter periplasmic adaptor subunit n=1 Tax=Cupriavidus sp. DF5525 TaxID=3160989 RepID=UPI0003B0BF93|nr:hemolysin secretion protein D [Ralstonia pickettii DTP0602]